MSNASHNTARKITCLTEDVFAGGASGSSGAKIDKEAGVFRGVKILGAESKNGRQYTPQAMQEAAKLYEGMGVNLSHLGKNDAGADLHGNQPVERGFGWLENIVVKPDGVYGDMPYLKSHPQAAMIVEAAERNPNRFGLSHHAYGRAVKKNGKIVVESTQSVKSVDIVQNPATTSGFFESENQEFQDMSQPEKTTLKKFVESIDKANVRQPVLLKLLEMDDGAYGDASMDVPAPEPEMDSDDQVAAAFKTMIDAVLDSDLDIKGKISKIKEILTAEEKLTGAGDGGANAEPEKEAAESARKEREAHASELLEAAGIKAEPAKIKALAAVDSSHRKALVESWKQPAAQPGKAAKPARSQPLIESAPAVKTYPADQKSFVSSIK